MRPSSIANSGQASRSVGGVVYASSIVLVSESENLYVSMIDAIPPPNFPFLLPSYKLLYVNIVIVVRTL